MTRNTWIDGFDYILNYPNFALGILDTGKSYAKVFVEVKRITGKNTKETKELLDSQPPIIIKKDRKRDLINDCIALKDLGAICAIIFIDENGEMHWTKKVEIEE